MADCRYLRLRKERENRCLVLTSSTRREIRRVQECGECLSAIAFSLSELLVTNDLEPSEKTHFTENQAKRSGVLYFVFPQVNEGVRNQENTDRLEWLQAHVNLESIGEVRNRFYRQHPLKFTAIYVIWRGTNVYYLLINFAGLTLRVEKKHSFHL